MDRPITLLFTLMSVDGKISIRSADESEVDLDFPKILGEKEGLHQYNKSTRRQKRVQRENKTILRTGKNAQQQTSCLYYK